MNKNSENKYSFRMRISCETLGIAAATNFDRTAKCRRQVSARYVHEQVRAALLVTNNMWFRSQICTVRTRDRRKNRRGRAELRVVR